jgi:hypothetical protein
MECYEDRIKTRASRAAVRGANIWRTVTRRWNNREHGARKLRISAGTTDIIGEMQICPASAEVYSGKHKVYAIQYTEVYSGNKIRRTTWIQCAKENLGKLIFVGLAKVLFFIDLLTVLMKRIYRRWMTVISRSMWLWLRRLMFFYKFSLHLSEEIQTTEKISVVSPFKKNTGTCLFTPPALYNVYDS